MIIYSSITTEELVRRCAEGNPEAWTEFLRRFQKLIAVTIFRIARRNGSPSPQLVNDLVQEVYAKLCVDDYRILASFEAAHVDAFARYLQVLAGNIARDHFKSRRSQRRGADHVVQLTEGNTAIAGDHSAGAERIERTVLFDQVARHLKECLTGQDAKRNEQIFWLYYRDGLTTAAIAQLPGIGLKPKGVESIIARLTKQLRDKMGHEGV